MQKRKHQRTTKVSLTTAELSAVLDSLNAPFAGDTSEGDLSWSDEHEGLEFGDAFNRLEREAGAGGKQ